MTSKVALIYKTTSLVDNLQDKNLSKCRRSRESVHTQRPQMAMTAEGWHVSARAATRRDTIALSSSARTRSVLSWRFSLSPHPSTSQTARKMQALALRRDQEQVNSSKSRNMYLIVFFLQASLTAQQSLQSVQTLLKASLGCITYLR